MTSNATITSIVFHPAQIRALLRDRKVQARMEELGEMVAERARQRVRVDSGDLRDSIRVETVTTNDVPEIRVVAGGGKVDYQWYVELGTEHSRPRPFLRPALAFIRKGEGGSGSGLGRVRASRSAREATKRNRAAARARKAG